MKAKSPDRPGFVSGPGQSGVVAPDLYQHFFESNPAVMWIKDEDGRYVYVNRQLESVYHISSAAIFGHTDSELLPAETAKELRDHDLLVLKQNLPFTTIEHIPDGQGIFHDWKVVKFPFTDHKGRKYVGGFAVRCDHNEGRDRKAQTAAAEMDLLQRSAQAGVLAASVAHDANNLLTIILGHLSLLKDSEEDSSRNETWTRIEKACKGASHLLRTMAALTKDEADTRGRIDINACLQNVTCLVGGTFAQGVKLHVEANAAAAIILGDRIAMEQVLLNLIFNARDALPRGGEITLRTFNSARVDGVNTVSFEIQDNGCGIPPEHLSRIFEPFFTTKPNQNGCGLGLWSVKRTVEAYGGVVEVESSVGNGTRVRLTFTLVSGEGTRSGSGVFA